MNRIEDEWLHLKQDELAERVFEGKYDLAIAIKQGLQATQQGDYGVKRLIFN